MDLLTKQLLITKHETFQTIYHDDRDYQCAYEAAYYYEFGILPPGHYIIDSVELVNGSSIFVHRDSENTVQ